MVVGLKEFAAAFEGLGDQYVLIGGVAAHLWFKDAELVFRKTVDLDIVLCVEALDSKFVDRFWRFIGEGEYQVKESRDGAPMKYRFTDPKRSEYPAMLELFAPAKMELPVGQHIVPIAVDEEQSNLSAILLDERYHQVVIECRELVDNVMCLTPQGLILLTARAWLDMKARRAGGEHVDSREIKKHRNDVFRLAVLLEDGGKFEAQAEVLEDLEALLSAVESSPEEQSAIQAACSHLPLNDPIKILGILRSQSQ